MNIFYLSLNGYKYKGIAFVFIFLFFFSNLQAQQLFQIDDLQYEGGFRITTQSIGISNMNYAQGPIEYNSVNHSLFIVGHSHHQAIAEFAIPQLDTSSIMSDLIIADSVLQTFSTVIGKVPGGNPQLINRIGGMEIIHGTTDTSLIVNCYEYYDAPANNTHSTFVLHNANDLAATQATGFHEFSGIAGHTCGWISPVPPAWQNITAGEYITGHSSGIPIMGRLSIGPSAFSFNSTDVISPSTATTIPTNKMLDFSLTNPLNSDLSNTSLTNDIWTHLSRATYGMIVPGTSTYLTIGHSGGHNSGVCYKCTQNNGNLCGGYCAPDHEDYYKYYWLWDMNDLIKVKNGTMNSYDVYPYDYGEFQTPFSNSVKIGGGTFDPQSGLLYLTLIKADTL